MDRPNLDSRESLMALGRFIRAQRELMSLSLRKVAETARISNPYLSQVERGLHRPSAQVLKGIATALDLSAENLYQQAGLLDPDTRRDRGVTVEEAIRADRRLSTEHKLTLIQVYRGFVGGSATTPKRKPTQTARARR